MKISDFSDEDLERELHRRKILSRHPRAIENPDWQPLVDLLEEGIQKLSEGSHLKDWDHWIYEAALEALYGHDIWTWINNIE
jgi:hypothetical protein